MASKVSKVLKEKFLRSNEFRSLSQNKVWSLPVRMFIQSFNQPLAQDIKANDLESKICKARASSGSDITVSVSDEIYAKASSGADINYYGSPQIRDTDESSGGDVRQR